MRVVELLRKERILVWYLWRGRIKQEVNAEVFVKGGGSKPERVAVEVGVLWHSLHRWRTDSPESLDGQGRSKRESSSENYEIDITCRADQQEVKLGKLPVEKNTCDSSSGWIAVKTRPESSLDNYQWRDTCG